jgi:hypothetical protein
MVLTSGLVWMPAAESAAARGCTNIPGSAIDQYCEVVPTVTGGRVPDGHAQPVGATLPGPQRRRLTTAAGQRLARLPAPNRIVGKGVSTTSGGGRQQPTTSATGGRSTRSAAGVSALSLSLPLIVVLVVSAVGLIGTAAVGRSRRRSRS